MPQSNSNSLRREFVNPYALLLPLLGFQDRVYRFSTNPPPGLEGYQPRWEVVNAVLGAQQQIQVKIDVMRDFHLLALLASATVNTVGGFRVHLAHAWREPGSPEQQTRRFGSDRGLKFGNLGGTSAFGFFLREPYRFDLPQSQVLVILQNLEPNPNTVQLVLYGVAAPFTGSDITP